jgi:hypothetical protein
MLAAARGMETWARTVRIPVYTTTPPPDGWQEVCRAELERPQVWYLTITSGELDAPVSVVARVRCGNGLTTWLEERKLYAYQSHYRMMELWIPARSVEVDVVARSEYEQPDLAVTGSLAPIVLPRFGVGS